MTNDYTSTKQQFINILTEACSERFDVQKFIKYLEDETDFFYAPASTKFHLAERGGLLKHSVNVYLALSSLNMMYDEHIDPASLAICGLLHDICKTNFYTQEYKNVKVNGVWTQELQYVVNDKFPIGHGEKSVIILQQHFKLTDDEIIAIRWHMNGFDAAVRGGDYAYSKATQCCKLLSMLEIADLTASRLLETNFEKETRHE